MFLNASTHLYMRVCLSVRPSVRGPVGPSVSIKEKTPKSTKIRGREGDDKGGGDKGWGECGDKAGDASDGRVSGLVKGHDLPLRGPG